MTVEKKKKGGLRSPVPCFSPLRLLEPPLPCYLPRLPLWVLFGAEQPCSPLPSPLSLPFLPGRFSPFVSLSPLFFLSCISFLPHSRLPGLSRFSSVLLLSFAARAAVDHVPRRASMEGKGRKGGCVREGNTTGTSERWERQRRSQMRRTRIEGHLATERCNM